jgi:hypothetical protein
MSTTAGRKPGSPYEKAPYPTWPEYNTLEGARRHKRMLEAYYRDHKLPVPEFRVERLRFADKHGGGNVYGVRSNLKNGLPK